ncbi:MAG TPA: ABC transporter ATP-binding protein, partial [Baekduia sp.]
MTTPRSELRRIAALFRPYRMRLFVVLAIIALSAGLSMISPFLLREVLDSAIPDRDNVQLTWLVLGMIAVAIVTGALGVAST